MPVKAKIHQQDAAMTMIQLAPVMNRSLVKVSSLSSRAQEASGPGSLSSKYRPRSNQEQKKNRGDPPERLPPGVSLS